MMRRIIFVFSVVLPLISLSPEAFSEMEGPCRRDPYLIRCLPTGCQELTKDPHIYEQSCIAPNQVVFLQGLGILSSDKEGHEIITDLSREECKRWGGKARSQEQNQRSQFFRQTQQTQQAQQTRRTKKSPEGLVPCTFRMTECRCEETDQPSPEQRSPEQQREPEQREPEHREPEKERPAQPPVEILEPPVPVPPVVSDPPVEEEDGHGETVRIDGERPSSATAVPIFFCVADSREMYEASTGRAWPMADPCPRVPRERLVSPDQFAFSDNVTQFLRDQRRENLEKVQQNTVRILDQVLEGKTNHPILAVTINEADEKGEEPLVTLTPLQDRPEKFRRFRENFEENFQIDGQEGKIVSKHEPAEEDGTYMPLIPEDLDSPDEEPVEEEPEGEGKKPKKKPGEDHGEGSPSPEVPPTELPALIKSTQTLFPSTLPQQSVLVVADRAEALGGGCSLLLRGR